MKKFQDEEILGNNEIKLSENLEENKKSQKYKDQNIDNEKRIKPHEKVAPDYTIGILPSQEETADQAPLVVIVQGSKNVSYSLKSMELNFFF